ncbi:hypothetical protein L1987_10999 [Smallanthus sonchifolius]|uniref:Uncharacterized protein n=1 Tax=Smallanthus sonchifolius TaxID=185202 RepID=A0ACB9JBS4_9ASTR|nr:hypothetical protein L1987_10999 [Smallanthus sonchifolius]
MLASRLLHTSESSSDGSFYSEVTRGRHRFNSAHQMFDKIIKRDLMSWNVMITEFIPNRFSYRFRFDPLLM